MSWEPVRKTKMFFLQTDPFGKNKPFWFKKPKHFKNLVSKQLYPVASGYSCFGPLGTEISIENVKHFMLTFYEKGSKFSVKDRFKNFKGDFFMGDALNFSKTGLTQPKGFGIKQNSNIKTKKNIKKKIKSKAQTQNQNAGTASISSSNKNRLKWLSNWKRVFSFWRWSPGIFFISSIQKSIPVYYKEYNPAKQKSLSKSTAFLKDSKTRLWKDQITKLSEIEKKEYQKRNSFYILQYLNLENHPFFNGEFA
jgi:hypothetical protein